VLVGAALALTACASGRGRPLATSGKSRQAYVPEAERVIHVQVTNNRFEELRVYVRDDQGELRNLGSVASQHRRRFKLDAGMVGQGNRTYVLLADPVGSREALRSDPLSVSPGETAYWIVGSRPELSSSYVGD